MKEDTCEFFDASDLPLLHTAIGLFPDLLSATACAKLVRQRLQYPIEDACALKELVAAEGSIVLGQQRVTIEQIDRFLPESFFPIESEPQLLQRLLIAFQIGHNSHYYDRARETVKPQDFDEALTILPSPTARPVVL